MWYLLILLIAHTAHAASGKCSTVQERIAAMAPCNAVFEREIDRAIYCTTEGRHCKYKAPDMIAEKECTDKNLGGNLGGKKYSCEWCRVSFLGYGWGCP